MEFSPFRNGDGWLLGVGDLGCGDAAGTRRAFEVRLPDSYHLYDTRAGQYLGKAETLQADLPRGGHRAYALLPYRVTGVEVALSAAVAVPGKLIRLAVRLQTEGGKPSGHVLRVTAHASNQKQGFFPFKRIVPLPENGALELPLRLAYNDPNGVWKITVADISTGVEGTVPLTVRGGTE